MPFRVPTFNLVCGIYRSKGGGPFPPGNPTLTSPCQLRYPGLHSQPFGTAINLTGVLIALPARTDVRAAGFGIAADAIECPFGSGRFYLVRLVDDVAKGFPNEYRVALCVWENNSPGGWPYPTP